MNYWNIKELIKTKNKKIKSIDIGIDLIQESFN